MTLLPSRVEFSFDCEVGEFLDVLKWMIENEIEVSSGWERADLRGIFGFYCTFRREHKVRSVAFHVSKEDFTLVALMFPASALIVSPSCEQA
jgi:hypothetical protein